jgi:hypothetical protein
VIGFGIRHAKGPVLQQLFAVVSGFALGMIDIEFWIVVRRNVGSIKMASAPRGTIGMIVF